MARSSGDSFPWGVEIEVVFPAKPGTSAPACFHQNEIHPGAGMMMHRAQAFRLKARVFQGHEQTAQPLRAKDHAKPTAPAGGPTGGGAEILQSTGAVAPGILKAEGGVVAGAGFKIGGIGHGKIEGAGGDQIPILPEIPGNEPGPVRKAVALKIRLGQIAGLGAELHGGCGGDGGHAQQQHRQNG